MITEKMITDAYVTLIDVVENHMKAELEYDATRASNEALFAQLMVAGEITGKNEATRQGEFIQRCPDLVEKETKQKGVRDLLRIERKLAELEVRRIELTVSLQIAS